MSNSHRDKISSNLTVLKYSQKENMMQLTSSHSQFANLQAQASRKPKKSTKPEVIKEHFIAPFCTNKAGEKGPKTDLGRLLGSSCDCV